MPIKLPVQGDLPEGDKQQLSAASVGILSKHMHGGIGCEIGMTRQKLKVRVMRGPMERRLH